MRLNSDGSRDTSFDIGGGLGSISGSINTILLEDNGGIIIGGAFTQYKGKPAGYLIKLLH